MLFSLGLDTTLVIASHQTRLVNFVFKCYPLVICYIAIENGH